jgi:hypothetical protein
MERAVCSLCVSRRQSSHCLHEVSLLLTTLPRNPFSQPVAMLLFRIAQRMFHSTEDPATIRSLLSHVIQVRLVYMRQMAAHLCLHVFLSIRIRLTRCS